MCMATITFTFDYVLTDETQKKPPAVRLPSFAEQEGSIKVRFLVDANYR